MKIIFHGLQVATISFYMMLSCSNVIAASQDTADCEQILSMAISLERAKSLSSKLKLLQIAREDRADLVESTLSAGIELDLQAGKTLLLNILNRSNVDHITISDISKLLGEAAAANDEKYTLPVRFSKPLGYEGVLLFNSMIDAVRQGFSVTNCM